MNKTLRNIAIVLGFVLVFSANGFCQFSKIISIRLLNNNDSVAKAFQSNFSLKVGTHCTWSLSGTVATIDCLGAGGTIGGSIANTQVAVGSGVNTISGSASLTYTGTLNVTAASMMNGILVTAPDDNSLQLLLANASVPLASGAYNLDDSGSLHMAASPNGVINSSFNLTNSGRITVIPDAADRVVAITGQTNSTSYGTATNCADSAGAAACGSAAAGAFVVDAAATTTVVSTTAVTANSEILVFYDSSLGTRLSVTCNTAAALPAVTARTAATSFTITVPVAPITNPLCLTYTVVNCMKTLKALAFVLPFFLIGAALAVAQDYRFGNIYSNGSLVQPALNGATSGFPSVGMQRMTYMSATPLLASTNSNNFTTVGDTTAVGGASQCGSGLGAKTVACGTNDQTTAYGWSTVSTDGYPMGHNITFVYRSRITTPTNVRLWTAPTNQTIITMCGSANPAGSYIGWRFDTGAGDTHWQATTKDGTTQTIVDTGIAPVTATDNTFAIVQSNANSNVTFYIDGVLVATIATHLPATNTALGSISGIRSLSGTGQNWQGNYGYIFLDF